VHKFPQIPESRDPGETDYQAKGPAAGSIFMEQPNVKFMHMNVYGRSKRDCGMISPIKVRLFADPGIPFATH